MAGFAKLVYSPAAMADAALAICACRAGGVGILNAELTPDEPALLRALDDLAAHANAPYGIKLDAFSGALASAVRLSSTKGLRWLIVDAEILGACRELATELRHAGVRVLAEVTSCDWEEADLGSIDGLMLKGNESGGFVGEDSSFILLQKWRQRTKLPLYIRGGVTPHVAAGCASVGVAGVALDSQLLLMNEVRLPQALSTLIGNLSGSETLAVGHGEIGEYFRLLVRPSLTAAKKFAVEAEGLRYEGLRIRVLGHTSWQQPDQSLLPIGQDVAFAAPWRKRFGSVGAVLRAIDAALDDHLPLANHYHSIAEGAPLARALGVRYPIVQGPMTRVSDTAEFALAVAEGGALPMIAFAVLKGQDLVRLLERSAELLGKRPWGIGLLGFAPQELLDEQLAIAQRFAPNYAIIAGGRPDQAVHLEQSGVPTFLHVPSANLIPTFLQEGARRFIFEGRECGGHIGPVSSFVLWSSMVDRILAELAPCKVRGEELELIFAGGIHDQVSSALLQVMTAPLAAVGAKIGILMGSAYLFTQEIVASGSIVAQFQKEVLDCEHTVNLESGVGHASRCAYSPFARDFFRQRLAMRRSGVPAEERRRLLDELILGRLRIASKGRKRDGVDGAMQALEPAQQHEEGMYMLGQVATLRAQVTDIRTLHHEVTAGAAALLEHAPQRLRPTTAQEAAQPADVAIVGIACVLPKANSTRDYWENILSKVNAITEIPSHRWDWRMYFDADRDAKDKIYSKWGGFLDDLAFDPTQYGMPPKSIEAIDPMQLMGLEVAYRTLVDTGYHAKPFDRERASVIIGASGGIGDVGMQYGLRSELPRFVGDLASDVAERLPEWTEDSFAGILPNVAAGRIANRLNFGGMNLTTDAACASSLAAVYQAVTELVAKRSDFVIAGGLDTVQGPFGYLCFSKTQALSPRGLCSTFDVSGDGIVISEGIAMVALKRLADAQRDGDRIYAVIKGVGASSDGSAKGMTAPLPAGQLRAMRRAYHMAGFGPATVGLFEAHGTGTVAGDTAELESTTQLIKEQDAAPRQAVIGSVKTMIGHTKATAGAAGLIKAVLALHHRVLPPHNNVSSPIAALADAAAPLYIVDEAMPWLSSGGPPRRAASSAFGFGGTNFHVVLEEYRGEYRDWLRPAASHTWSAELFLWSDSDKAALTARVEAFCAQIAPLEGLVMRDVAASLAASFHADGLVLAVVARNSRDLSAKLGAALGFLRGDSKASSPGVFYGAPAGTTGRIAVLFSGQGSQYPNMGREAALHFDCVSETLGEADRLLKDAFETRFGPASALSKFIFPRGAYSDAAKLEARQRLASTDVAQPALGAVETGLLRLMREFGLQADMFAGHSYGEFVALHAAGAIDFEALMQLSAARGRFIIDAASAAGAELGTMAAVNASRERVENALKGIDGVVLANHNGPTQSVISGTQAGVQAAVRKLRQAEIEVTDIPVAAAFHSSLVRPAQQSLSDMIGVTPWAAATAPVYSNSTGRAHSEDPAEVKRQMAEHLVHPVEFVAQVEAMYADGARIFVEIGPKSVLARLASRILHGREHVCVSVDDGSGLGGLLGGIGQLLCAGVKLDISRLFARRDCRIGDASQPATLLRPAHVSKYAWMLNGSGVRRAAEPVQQIGVTLEQALDARQATAQRLAPRPATAAPAAPAALAASAAAPTALPGDARRESQPHALAKQSSTNSALTAWRKDRSMDERRTADSSVISEYFETMRQFLETQERVMAAFLGEGSVLRPVTRTRSLPLNAPRVAELAAAPAVVPTAKLHVPAPAAAPAPTPVAAAAVKPAPTPAPVAAPAAQPKPAAAAAATPVLTPTTNGAGLTREKLLDALLTIVEEKTGYPRDMLGLDQNLEADLGIDSIKRVEVVGALLKMLPDGYREALTQSRGKLNTQSTLNGMLSLIMQEKAGGSAHPFELAGTGEKVDAVNLPSRLIMRAQREPLTPAMNRRLTAGRFVMTRDSLGVAELLAAGLRNRGAEVLLVDPEVSASEERLVEFCRSMSADRPIGGIVHLGALDSPPLLQDSGPREWRAAIYKNEKSFFLLLRGLHGLLAQGAQITAASALGGLFGREGSASGALQLQGGAPGTLKSLNQERPDLRVKAVDLDPARAATELAADLLAEIELDGGRQEVGYPQGQRTIFLTVEQAVPEDAARESRLENLVVLATGGARGITAEVLRELARPGNTLILTGRSHVPESESADTARLTDATALRNHFVEQVRAGKLQLNPGEIRRRVQSLLDLRELRANLADFRSAGAVVEYHSVDVTDEAAVSALVADVQRRHRRIDGVVHGAGIIEDKLLADKASDSWSRVIETKLMGLLLLQKYVDRAALKFFTVFSSVAGRYGNSGQSDYATANELMNRVCVALQARWGKGVVVSALCWGPWGATKFGAGMVTAETEKKFEKRGVYLVTANMGRRLFREELGRADDVPVEVICGQGPWEAQEAELGIIHLRAEAPAAPELGPLLGSTAVSSRSTGEKIVDVRLDPSRHTFMKDQLSVTTAVLSPPVALELMAEAARGVWPKWRVVEVRELRVPEPVELPNGACDLRIHLSPPPYGSSEGFDVSASIKIDLGSGRWQTLFQGVIGMQGAFPAAPPAARAVHSERSLSVPMAYGQWLSRGPLLQVIESIDGFSATGAGAKVRATVPSQWLAPGQRSEDRWMFDPAFLDAAGQMVSLWARAYRGEATTPSWYGRVIRFQEQMPARMHMEFTLSESPEPAKIRGQVVFSDDHGAPLLAIEDFDCSLSARPDSIAGKVGADKAGAPASVLA
jgi:acyl transferase domain-containing protein/NAD(P)H-dependent flavin oxidoreductase YrpB (nitropropane dioxygenase family)